MASITSAFTIEISSMTSVSIAFMILRAGSDCSSSLSAISPIGSRNSEWIVCPSTLSAATPVGAHTAICLSVFQARCCSSVDFPVPARPVTNTCSRVSSMRRNSSSCSAERGGRLIPSMVEGNGATSQAALPRLGACREPTTRTRWMPRVAPARSAGALWRAT